MKETGYLRRLDRENREGKHSSRASLPVSGDTFISQRRPCDQAGADTCAKSHRRKLHASWSGPRSGSFLASRCEEVCAQQLCSAPALHPPAHRCPCRSCRVDWVPPWRAESKAAPCRPASHFLLILQLSRCLVVTAHFTEGRLCCRHWAKHFSR